MSEGRGSEMWLTELMNERKVSEEDLSEIIALADQDGVELRDLEVTRYISTDSVFFKGVLTIDEMANDPGHIGALLKKLLVLRLQLELAGVGIPSLGLRESVEVRFSTGEEVG